LSSVTSSDDDISAIYYATSGGSLSRSAAPLTEAHHSRIVELNAALRDFLSVDGGGVPAQVLSDGEQRLRRLLNLWFTPTLEVVREYWRQTDAIATSGGGAAAAAASRDGSLGVVRPAEGGGVGPLDLIQLLAQRGGVSSDGEAAVVVDAQLSAAGSVNVQAVLGIFNTGEDVMASFVCRFDATTLAGRLFITSSCIGFSSCGVGPDHPHDAHSAVVVPINHVVRAFKGDASDGGSLTPTLNLLLVDSRSFQFGCFAGGARARDLALEALRLEASASHPQAPFLVAAQNSDEGGSAGVVLLPGERLCSSGKFSCALHDPAMALVTAMEPAPTHVLLDSKTGTVYVTSAALLWLPDDEDGVDTPGLRIPYEDIDAADSGVAVSRQGWDDHAVSVDLKVKPAPRGGSSAIRFIHLTESGALALQGELCAAAAICAARHSDAGEQTAARKHDCYSCGF